MWFGSWDGLIRFDGYDFKVFKPQHQDTKSIAGEHINSIVEDKTGDLWVGTNECLNRYDYAENIFEHYYIPNENGKELVTLYDPFFIDVNNELWFTYNKEKLASINVLTKNISFYPFADGLLGSYTAADFPKEKLYRPLQTIFSCGNDGLSIIDPITKKTYRYFSTHKDNLYGDPMTIFEAFEDSDHLMWLATEKGLISFDPANESELVFNSSVEGKKISQAVAITEDGNNRLWVGTDWDGLWIFDKKNKSFTRQFLHNTSDPASIGSNAISSVYADRSGNIWLNVDPLGIDKVSESIKQFSKIRVGTTSGAKVNSESILGFVEMENNDVMVSCSRSGFFLFNKSNWKGQMVYLPQPYKENHVSALFRDSKDRYYILAEDGLFYSNNPTGPFKILRTFINKSIDELFGAMLQIDDSNILIGYHDGLALVKGNGKELSWQDILPEIKDNIVSVSKGKDGMFYLCGKKRFIIRLHYAQGSFGIMDTINTDCLVKSIYHHSEEIIWLATNKGLAKYEVKSNKFQWYTEQQGLANNLVYTIVPDDNKNLWLSTNGGISRFNLTTQKFHNYNTNEGLQGNEFNSNSSCKTSDGTIYFGGVNGFNYFNPSEINELPFDSPVHITEIKINNKRVSLAKMRNGKNYSLSYKQNNIAVSFAAIDFIRAAKISYEYQLQNSGDWIAIGKDRSLTFPQLPAGDYQLNVRARLSDGTISNHIGSLQFEILPPWYNTAWFYAICGFSALGFLYLLYRYRLNQVIKFYHFRTKISQDLHDEVGSTLTSIGILSKVSQSNLEKDKSKSAALLKKISEQAADMQQSMSDIVWSIRPDNDKMDDLIIRMREYLGQTAEAKNFEVEFFADEGILKENLSMEQRQHLLLIFKEAVNNAVKYSKGKKVSVVIEKVNRSLKLKVQDDGVGFNMERIRSSNGLKNMRNRAKELNGTLEINSLANGGTVVEFTGTTT